MEAPAQHENAAPISAEESKDNNNLTSASATQLELEEARQRQMTNFDKIFHYVMGIAPAVSKIVEDKPVIIQFPNMFLRAYGAPVFINNPFAGFIILMGTLIENPWHGILGILGLISAILTSLLSGQLRDDVISGGSTFHGLLIGLTLAATSGKATWYAWLVFPVFVLGAVR